MNFKGFATITAVALTCVALWHFYGGSVAKTKEQTPVLVQTAMVQQQNVPLEISTVGTVIAYESVAVRSRLDSQVMEVHFHDGDTVKKGATLFVLDDRALKAQKAQLEANVRRDKAQLENLNRQYERAKDLASKGFESKARMDDTKAALDVQRANVKASEAALENIRVQLDYTRIIAPIDGRTGTINITVGNTVKANDTAPIVTINQVRPIRVQAPLSQSYFDAVRMAMKDQAVAVLVQREDGGDVAEGTLEYIDNAVDQATGTFVTRAVFNNEEERLWPGMFVNLLVKLGEEKQALTVPETAVQHGQGGDYVFVIAAGEKTDVAQKRSVTVSRSRERITVISKGLAAGERVATDGIMSLKDGGAVTVQQATKEPALDAAASDAEGGKAATTP